MQRREEGIFWAEEHPALRNHGGLGMCWVQVELNLIGEYQDMCWNQKSGIFMCQLKGLNFTEEAADRVEVLEQNVAQGDLFFKI